ncbi:nephrocystin-1-like [Anneissia japonica]|uniref:nephrocystin-1-like n=1 Tax=Anneissia japonica TaxID=1529436 RepID=UPI001425585E|nr:nephrocystin-1-like [Anneissia japonica]
MPNKKSPLQEVQREGDTLKRDVDKFVDECQKFIDDTTVANSDKKLKTLQKRCQEYDNKITSLSQKASKLDRVNEPSSTSKFEEKKQQEIKRLETLKVQLDRISSKLEPDEIEEEYLREMSQELDDNSPKHEGKQNRKQSKSLGEDVGSDLSDDDEIENDQDEEEEDEEEDDDEEGESDTQETKESKEDEAERKEDSKTPTTKQSGEGRFSRLSIFRRSSKKKEVPPAVDEQGGGTDSKKNKKEKEKTEKEKKEPEKKKEKQDKKLKEEGKTTKKAKSSGKEKKNSPKPNDSVEVDDASKEEESVEKEKPEKETKTGWRLFGKQDRKMKQENTGSTSKKKEEKKNGKGKKVEEEKSSKRKATDIQGKKTDVKKGKIAEVDEDEDEYEDEEDEYEDEEDYDELDEEEVTEDEEEYEEESNGLGLQLMDLFEAVCDYNAEQDGDLSFKVGDILTIINTREDGWWTAEDEEGNKGLVPSTYLKMKKEPEDYRNIQSPEDAPETELSRSGKVLWKGLRKAVRETSATDVLSAMGAIPSGFRPSTTAKLLKEDQYSLQYCLTPKLSKSNLSFKDLFWDPAANEIRARNMKMQKVVVLTGVRNIPKVGVGVEVKSRHVRLCLFNGEKVLSNIHTVQATWTEVDDKSWRFSPKVTGVLPSILDGDCFLRTNSTDENLGLLIELCLYYVRTKTGEKGEFSCGWVNLPLFDPTTGAPILNKNYELDVKGGTPYEQDVEVDPSISRKASTSKFRSMLSVNKQPRLSLKLLGPTKEQKTSME